MEDKRLVSVRGNDYERGLALGKQTGYSIRVNFLNRTRHYKEAYGYDYGEWVRKAQVYVPLIKEHTPHTYDEMRGMADGAGVPFEHVLALTTDYEITVAGGSIADKCTGFFAAGDYTSDRGALCGQTNDEDLGEWIPFLDVAVRHTNTEGPSALVYTHPGITAYMGMNDAGLAILWQYIDNGERAMGVPTNCIIREVLFYDSLDDAVAFLQKVPHCIPNHYLISSKDKGAASVECYPSDVFVVRSDDHLCHTNNVLTPEKMDGCDKKSPLVYREQPLDLEQMMQEAYEGALQGTPGVLEWSYLRLDRITELLEQNKGSITPEKARWFLADHVNEPFSICSHPNFVNTRWKTLASMVFDLERAQMHIAFGCACEEPFHTYTFER
ncbi:MAG: hypothetical protein IJ131_07135 [Eggerthellaceae bacterium]|nr:hypothetical protein [Eggerthellaceae bacterium]